MKNQTSEEKSENKASSPQDTTPPALDPLEQKEKEIKELNDRHIRLVAEFDNYKKRSAREHLEFKKYAYEPVLLEILPILDNLERALFHTKESQEPSGIEEGLQLVIKQSKEVLSRLEVTPIPAKGEFFNPAIHQAISQVETEDMEDNRVVDEISRGYFFKDRVLRPAMVSVSRKKSAS